MSQTAEKPAEWIPEIERSDVAVRLPVAQQFVKDIGMSGSQWRVLTDQIFPAAKTVQAIAMAIAYCKTRQLDIFKRPVHIVPMWSSALGKMVETVWPGISELRTTAARTGEYAGIDEVIYGPDVTHTFKGEIEQWVKPEGGGSKVKQLVIVEKTITYPKWASVVVYRLVKGQRFAFHTKVFWLEAYATMGKSDVPNEMWTDRPYGQLDKCVEAAGLRKAFPEEIGNDYSAEEMHGKVLPADVAGVAAPEPTRPAKPDQAKPTEQAKPGDKAKPAAAEKPKPAATNMQQESEHHGGNVVDADYEEEVSFTQAGTPHDPETGEVEDEEEGEFIYARDGAGRKLTSGDLISAYFDDLQAATTAEQVEEISTKHDLLAVFQRPEDDQMDANISIVTRLKADRLKALAKGRK